MGDKRFINSDIQFGFGGWNAQLNRLEDGRMRARAVVAGKTFETFGSDEKEANNKLEFAVRKAVEDGDIILNQTT